MVEPDEKRLKRPFSPLDDGKSKLPEKIQLFPINQLELIHKELRNKCLCPLTLSEIVQILSDCNEGFSSQNPKTLQNFRHETLLYTSMLTLFFEVSLKQKTKGIVCTRISEVVAAGSENEGAVIDILFGLLGVDDKYISYSAGRAIAVLLLMLKDSASQYILEHLVENISESSNLLEVGHSIDIIKRAIEWKDVDEHPLDESDLENLDSSHCLRITLSLTDTQGTNEVKYNATKTLESKWHLLTSRVTNLIAEYTIEKEHVIISFLSLWESLISVKANLSIIDTKEFYSGLERLLNLLNHHTPLIIWKNVLDLYNEVLCYGSTLALQDILAEEPCNLSHLIIRAVKDKQFLECVPCNGPIEHISSSIHLDKTVAVASSSSSPVHKDCSSSDNLNSTTPAKCHNTIIHKMVLLVLKSIAVTVKETRCDSSSENSSRSGGSGSEDIDMAIIEKSLREVIKKLDTFVKSKLPFHPECPMAEWMVRLFADQDDWLVESMVCGIDIYIGLEHRIRHHTELESWVNPQHTFSVFVETLHLDHDILLDLLVSNETCFLLYILRYLKLLKRNWHFLMNHSTRYTEQIMTVLIRLRLAIDRLVSKNLFPYNINPVLRLLEKCEELYDRPD